MKLLASVEIAPSGTMVELVTQELFIVKKEAKRRLLSKLLAQYHGSVLLFSRTKHNARKIMMSIRDMGYSAAEIHSNRSLAQRQSRDVRDIEKLIRSTLPVSKHPEIPSEEFSESRQDPLRKNVKRYQSQGRYKFRPH